MQCKGIVHAAGSTTHHATTDVLLPALNPIPRLERVVRRRQAACSSTSSTFGAPAKPRFQLTAIPSQEQRQVLCRCQRQVQTPEHTNPEDYVVVNFYHLVDVPSPRELVEQHRAWLATQGLDIRGRVYYSEQGVNAQYGGLRRDAVGYVQWLKSQPLWQGIEYSVWPSPQGHAFPKLRLKYKPNLISLNSGVQNFPVTDPANRATSLQPAEWKRMLAEAELGYAETQLQVLQPANTSSSTSQQQQERKVIVVDLRNDYEWDAGHFHLAERPKEQVFNETPVGEGDADVPEYMRNLSPDSPVMMYCTGGIRCDIYSAFLKRKGFNNLYTLHGGIQNYLRTEGPDLWKGSLYVFDGRMAIAGDQRDPEAAINAPLKPAVPCQLCGSDNAELPHVNCANIDCNALFIACAECKARLSGCCCDACMAAPRLLRPAKLDGGLYGSWGNYADDEQVGPIIATGRSEGRLARRARHRAALKEKHAKQAAERQARKAMLKEAMARFEEAERQRQQEEDQQQEKRDLQTLLARKQEQQLASTAP